MKLASRQHPQRVLSCCVSPEPGALMVCTAGEFWKQRWDQKCPPLSGFAASLLSSLCLVVEGTPGVWPSLQLFGNWMNFRFRKRSCLKTWAPRWCVSWWDTLRSWKLSERACVYTQSHLECFTQQWALQMMKITRLSSGCYFCLFQHFQDGRRAQQHIENSWKQLETVSDCLSSDICIILIKIKPAKAKSQFPL